MTGTGGRAGRISPTVIGFVAESSGMGRTNTISNVGWLLAASGSRVLVLDWSTEPAGVRNYLRPFQRGGRPLAELVDDAPGWLVEDAELWQHDIPVAGGAPGRLDVLSHRGPDHLAPRAGADRPGWAASWRRVLNGLPYDHVLVDAVTGTSEEAVRRTAELLEIAVVCFLPRRQAVLRAARTTRLLSELAPLRIRVLGAALQFDTSDESRAEHSRALVRDAFAEREVLEIPYYPYDEYDEALAVLLDDPAQPDSLLAAYLRLTAAITDRRVTAFAAPEDSVRQRYRRRLGLGGGSELPRIAVAYRPPQRPWADWVAGWLRLGGAEPLPVRHDDLAAVLPMAEAVVAIGDVAVPAGSPLVVPIDPAPGQSDEHDLADHLLGTLNLLRVAADAAPVPFPGALPPLVNSNLPSRNPAFTDRDDELEALRDNVLDSGGRRHELVGRAGAGKSELAKEYAHRFTADYDVIWWVPAHDLPSARASLVHLANLRGLAEQGDSVRALLHQLGAADLRWLLVFDNVVNPAEIRGLLPAAHPGGHVLLTTREPHPAADTLIVKVDVLPLTEGGDQLHAALPGLSREDATAVAAAVDVLPLALRLATAWLREAMTVTADLGVTQEQAAAWSAAELLNRLRHNAPEPPDGVAEPDGPPAAVRGVVGATLRTLAETTSGRLVIELARMVAHLSPEGVALDLIRSAEFVDRLRLAVPDEDLLRWDPAEIDRVIWLGVRHGLFEVDWGTSAALVQHRAVSDAVRLHAGPADDEVAARVRSALAALAPNEPDATRPGSQARYLELQRHLIPCGALACDDEPVRRWLVDHTRFLYLQGDGPVWRFTALVVEGLADRWAAACGPEDQLLLRLRCQLANIYRALGRDADALRLDEEVLAVQRDVLGASGRQTLITTRGRGGDLRGLGRFTEAFEEDLLAHTRFREILGKDHPDSLRAAANLALSAFLIGDAGYALEVQEDNFRRRLRLFGDHRGTWLSLAKVANYQCELGRYSSALGRVRTAFGHATTLHVPEGHPDWLLVNRYLGVAERLVGAVPAAKERHDRTLAAYRSLFGEAHPDVLGCSLSLAADHHELDAPDIAAEIAAHCLAGFRELRAEHPFTLLCELNLAVFLRAARRTEEAAGPSASAVRGLTALLGPLHPWTLTAEANDACLLAARGEREPAAAALLRVHTRGREHLSAGHPVTGFATEARDAVRRGGPPRSGLVVEVPQT